jgi:hypothetical protein
MVKFGRVINHAQYGGLVVVIDLKMGCLTALTSFNSQRHRNPLVKCWPLKDASTVWQPREFASKSKSSQGAVSD